MARTLLATLPAAALALRATRTTVSMHTNIFPTFTIKDKAAALGQRLLPRRRDFFFVGGAAVHRRLLLLPLRAARGGGGAREGTVRTLGAARPRPCAASRDESERAREKHEDER